MIFFFKAKLTSKRCVKGHKDMLLFVAYQVCRLPKLTSVSLSWNGSFYQSSLSCLVAKVGSYRCSELFYLIEHNVRIAHGRLCPKGAFVHARWTRDDRHPSSKLFTVFLVKKPQKTCSFGCMSAVSECRESSLVRVQWASQGRHFSSRSTMLYSLGIKLKPTSANTMHSDSPWIVWRLLLWIWQHHVLKTFYSQTSNLWTVKINQPFLSLLSIATYYVELCCYNLGL